MVGGIWQSGRKKELFFFWSWKYCLFQHYRPKKLWSMSTNGSMLLSVIYNKIGPDFHSQGLKTMLDCILCLKVCAWLTLMNTAAKDDSFSFFSSTLEAWRDDISFEKIWNHSEICVDLEFTGWCFRGRSAAWSCRDPDTEGKEVGTVSEYIILCMHLWSFLSAAFGLESVKNTLYILKILFPLSKSR